MTLEQPIYTVEITQPETLIASICQLVKCSEEEYCENMFKNGLAYLQWYLPCDVFARDQLERSRLFWNWFKKQYEECDKAFASSPGIGQETLKERRRLYRELHDPQALAVELKPNRFVLAEIKKKRVYELRKN